MTTEAAKSALARWAEHDRQCAWLPSDSLVIDQAEPLRQLLAERFVAAGAGQSEGERDLYHACLRYGRALAELDASPTLAAGALEGILGARDVSATVASGARAALLEGYVRSNRERIESACFDAFEAPRCFTLIDTGVAAMATSHPSTDIELLGPWAGRVAGALLARGVRRVILGGGGDGAATAPLQRELAAVGIDWSFEKPRRNA